MLEDKRATVHVELRELMLVSFATNCHSNQVVILSQELWRRINFGELLLQTATKMLNRFLTLFLLFEKHDLLFICFG